MTGSNHRESRRGAPKGRSRNFAKVREEDTNSLGLQFGALVRRYMVQHGLQLQDVARLVYGDEERAPRVSDVINGRYARPNADTISRYVQALKIPQTHIDDLFGRLKPADSLAEIEKGIASLARSRSADVRTIETLNDVIASLNRQLSDVGLSYEALRQYLIDFLTEVGDTNTDPVLWPAALRSLAGEIGRLRISLLEKTNEPSLIQERRIKAASAIAQGDRETARQLLEQASSMSRDLYEECRDNFLNTGENYARSLASLGSLAFSEFNYEYAKDCYSRALKIEGLQAERRLRYERSLVIAFTALMARCRDTNGALSILEEMKKEGVKPDEVTFNTLINLTNDYATGRAILEEMKKEGVKPDEVTFSTLINLTNDYATGRAILEEMKKEGVKPNEVTFSTLINLANDYATGRTILEEMKKEGVKPNEVTFSTLINLTNDYAAGRAILEEMKKEGVKPTEVTFTKLVSIGTSYDDARKILADLLQFRGRNPSEAELASAISKIVAFSDAVEEVLEFKKLGYFTGRSVYEVLFSRSVLAYKAEALLDIYFNLPYRFSTALQSPIKQYWEAGRLDEALTVSVAAAFTAAAAKFFKSEYQFCKIEFETRLQEAEEASTGDLHYAYGLAAALNQEQDIARFHLARALSRATLEGRVVHIQKVLATFR
ncbi:MAG: hypothetical protein JOZ13_13840 [Alphaproteobacteria bacterium]|nr:hypothetical protein [Alphaproteobacteria bacterium]